MASLNKVLLIGRLTRDPEKRSTPAGLTVCEIGLAMNSRYTTKDGQAREEVCFVDVTVWGKTAEACAEHLRKGASVFIEGRLKLDQWEKDGQKRSRMTVVADGVQFLDQRKASAPEGQDLRATPAQRPCAPVDQVQNDGGGDDIPF